MEKKKKKKKKKDDDVDVDVAQRERNSIKSYASAFSNILILPPGPNIDLPTQTPL